MKNSLEYLVSECDEDEFVFEWNGVPFIRSNDFLYHATKKLYLQSIQKKGLLCKSNSKIHAHPERVYFTLDKEGACKFAKHPVNAIRPNNIRKDGRPENPPTSVQELYSIAVILQIPINLLPETYILYNDPNYPNSCYGLNPIPWSIITVIDEFKVNK